MAKLWILSDLHLETLPYPDNFRPTPPAFDVLVAAGDIQEGDPGRGLAVLRRLAGDRPVVFVMGNHEHWNGLIDEDLALARMLAERAGITFLDGTSATLAGCRFVGATLWSDYRLAGHLDPRTPTGEPIEVAHEGGSHMLTIGDAAALHRRARTALVARIADDDGAVPVVVVTHHAPHPACIHPAQRGTWNAGNSASDLSALTDSGRAALWVHGHVHHSVDLVRPGGRASCAIRPARTLPIWLSRTAWWSQWDDAGRVNHERRTAHRAVMMRQRIMSPIKRRRAAGRSRCSGRARTSDQRDKQRRAAGPAGGSVTMKIKDATAGIEAQLRIQTRLILLIGILIAVTWLPPFIALFTHG